MEYRALPEDREAQFDRYLRYAFSPEDGPPDDEDLDRDLDEWPGDERAVFDDGEMRCVCRHYWFRTRHRGRWTEMPGLSAVASPPEHRRQGYVTRLLAESLSEYRDRGDYLTALWAFEHPFYDRQGWGLATKYVRYECDPDALSFARRGVDAAAGQFRSVDADDHEALNAVLAADHPDHDLAIDRTERWWRTSVFESWRTDPYAYGWVDDEGELRGYVVYRVEDEDDGKRLAVQELAAADPEARLHCLRFLANHDSQVERVSLYAPLETDLLDRVADPADVDCEVKAGPMVRLVDVPRAVEALEYPEAPDAEFTLAVDDPLADWNDATFRLAVEDGRATCERVASGATAEEAMDAGDAAASVSETAAVTTGVGPLSQVYVGYHSVADAERLTGFEVRDPAAREALSAMFPGRDVFLREGF
jgi:predicted acetyltransferase